jgi:hypothetical protein
VDTYREGDRYSGGDFLKSSREMSGGLVDLTADDSEDDHGLLADGRDDDFEFVEVKTPKSASGTFTASVTFTTLPQRGVLSLILRLYSGYSPNAALTWTCRSNYCCFIVMINDVTAGVLTASACVV